MPRGPPPPLDGWKAAHEALRKRLMEGLEAHGVRFEVTVVRGVAAAPVIVDYAAEHDIDLIMLGTHGRRGIRHLLLGSVAEEVVRTAHCPVFITRAAGPETPKTTGHLTILVPIDFSRHARLALRHAKMLAASVGARLVLLHVIEDQVHPAFYGISIQSVYDLVPDIEERSLRELEQFCRETEGPEVEARFLVRYGTPVPEIVALTKVEEVDLIVMATHGLRGLEHFMMGSVTEKVLRRSSVPVFTVRAFGKALAASPMRDEAELAV